MTQPRRARTSTRDPFRTKHSDNRGDRLPHSDKVDREDPARVDILITINRMELAGVTIDDRAVEIAAQLARWHHQQAMNREKSADAGEVPNWRQRQAERPSWVYYVRCGHLIKIGTSTNLASRFSAIRPNEVLALEPGGQIIETERHREFVALRASGEYFHPGVELQRYILSLRESLGAPTWTSSIVPDGQNFFAG